MTIQQTPEHTALLPLLPLRGVSVFPGMILNFDVERDISLAALNAAVQEHSEIFLVAQKDMTSEMPEETDLYRVGTVCTVRQILRIPGTRLVKAMVEGIYRAGILSFFEKTSNVPYLTAEIELLPDKPLRAGAVRADAVTRRCISLFETYAAISGSVTPEMFLSVADKSDPGYVADYIAQNVYMKQPEKQQILEELQPLKRAETLIRLLTYELQILDYEKDLDESTKREMDQSQRDYYLREQLKVIRDELGESPEDDSETVDDYRERILALQFPKETEEKLLKEVKRLAKQPYASSDAAVISTYLDTCLSVPWHTYTDDNSDIALAKKQLDKDHFGLDKVKDRVLDYLAVRERCGNSVSNILCLVGPPGVGKTSIAVSVAKAANRKLSRISLGGVHDEAEIRGHRKTYIGAMPGRIVDALIRAGSMNPLIVLDEIDKLGADYRGDPASAMLEALDSEQNHSFRDNYLEIPVNLRDVFFITTANTTDTIPAALLDRMEVIEIGSYTDEEKLRIAKSWLLPKLRKQYGLKASELKFDGNVLRTVIRSYTRESGVRVLERELSAVCRKATRRLLEEGTGTVHVNSGNISGFLGPEKYKDESDEAKDEIGLVHGLAWTSVGGEVLNVEVLIMDGSGKLELTGNLGDVMKESAHTCLSYVRANAARFGIDPEFYKNRDIHIHFPEGAVPKDGPSAGVSICTALVSALSGVPVLHSVAMTGEISLRGKVFPIGGLREKTMAAYRRGIKTVVLPFENMPDLDEIDATVRASVQFEPVKSMDEVLSIALGGKCPVNE